MALTSQKIIKTGNEILTTRPTADVNRATFRWQPTRIQSSNMGGLYPIFNEEVVGNTTVTIKPEGFHRLAPLVAPILSRINVRTYWFFCPWRIIWPNWEKFIVDQSSTGTLPPAMPFFANMYTAKGTLGDYLKVPVGAVPTQTVDKMSALMHYAYARIHQEWFMPEQFVNSLTPIEAQDGDNSIFFGIYNTLLKGMWPLDYYTSNMPWAQKGAAVVIPLTGSALPVSLVSTASGNAQIFKDAVGGDSVTGTPSLSSFSGDTIMTAPGGSAAWLDPNGSLGISASDVAQFGGNINDLRIASALQRFLELEALGGSRYQEYLWTVLGSDAGDARLNRPEYIGSTFQPLSISEVAQTSETSTTPQGNLAGRGVSGAAHDTLHYHAPEHGVIMGLQLTLPIASYHQGLPRFFSKFDKFDFIQPPLANVGSRPTLNREVYYDFGTPANNDLEFGYLPQYSEYRDIPNWVCGDFRDNLGYWLIKRTFSNLPQLSQQFTECDPPYDIFAVTSPGVDHIYSTWYFDVKVVQPLPKYVDPHLY